MSRSPRSSGASAVGQTAPIPLAHHPIRVRLVAVAALCAGSGLLVAACSSSNSASSSAGAARPAYGNAPGTSKHAAVYGVNNGQDAQAGPAKTTSLTKLAPNLSIIYTANLTIRVADVNGAANSATNDVAAVGGYIASEQQTQATSGGSPGEVDLTLKIPVTAYHQILGDLSRLGKHVMFDQQAQDVTQQVADVSSRVASAQAAIRQLRQLLTRAGNVGQLLSVQDEINNQEAQLESLIAQQQALAHETTYGTVNFTVLGHLAVAHKKKKHKKVSHGLIAGLSTGWRALKIVVVWLLTALGTLLPFALPIVAIGAIVYVGRRRMARRRTPPAAAPPATTS